MHVPTFGQVATIGMAFFAAAALAAPIAEPLDTDLVERSTDLAARGEGLAFAGAVSALEQRNSKKKCKRTNNKGYCTDSDDDKKDKKKKQCKRNKKGNCSDDEDEKKKGNQKDDKKNDDKKNDDKKNDDNKNGKDNKGGYY